jgi:2-oxoglutarate ferredoxin oxidoreductase subunit alpha
MSAHTPSTSEARRVSIIFSGDSGDGMQLTGTQFTTASAVHGNDVSTLPDYPSEIRAPAGSIAGVSAFQLSFACQGIHTPGDRPDVLVAMNPAALKVYLPRLQPGGELLVNRDAFTENDLKKAGYEENPLDDPELASRFKLHSVPITTLTLAALDEVDLDRKGKRRCKNFFALGLLYWLYDRPVEPSRKWIAKKFARYPAVVAANLRALEAGYKHGANDKSFTARHTVPPAPREPGDYRIINGNEAFALGSVTAAQLAGQPLVYSSYPITPATDVLHELSRLKHLDVRTIQAEDEIAAMGSAIGAAFGGAVSLTGTSGPGVCLKSEAIGLAIMLELPLVILNVQRGGPSTGLPTKSEQSDLLQAFAGRNGESPIPILAAASPADCFEVAIEAFRIAVRHTTPVFVLTDSGIGNGAELWRIPVIENMAPISVERPTDPEGFLPYARDESTLARPWAVPGTPGLEHRLGGLEKQHETGDVSHDPENHERMCRLRAEKVERIARFIPQQEAIGPPGGDLLVVSWGGTWGPVSGAVARCRERGRLVAHAHLRYLNPFPENLGELMARYKRVFVPELNGGQLALLLRARYLVDAISFPKLQGRPFAISEVETGIEEVLS